MEYGPDFDTALETLVCEFFIRLEELLPVPDFKQVWHPRIAGCQGGESTRLLDSSTVSVAACDIWK